MTTAIVGANGFVGTRMTELWHASDTHCVRPVVRGFTSLARLSKFDLDCRIADGLDEEALVKAFDGCEAVVHCVAGIADTIIGTAAPAYRAANRVGAKRLIYLSSASVHGQDPPSGTDESSPLSDKQWSWYNNAKVEAERRLQAARKHGDTQIVILRPGVVWGPRSRWISSFFEDLMLGQAYVLHGGKGVLNSIFVDNLIRATELAMEAQGVDGNAYIVQDDESVTWRDLYEPLCVAAGRTWEDVWDVPPYEAPRRTAMDRIESLRGSKTSQKVLPHVPSKLKRAGKAALKALPEPPKINEFALPVKSAPAATEEMSRLQSCGWRLPDAKARKALGYKVEKSFSEGMRISIDWLRMAGYPIQEVPGGGD